MFNDMTFGQLSDRADSLLAKADNLTEFERNNLSNIMDEMESRSGSKAPREERNGPSASDATMREVAGMAGGHVTRNAKSAEERAFDEYVRYGVIGSELRAAAQGEGTGNAGGFTVPQSFFDKLQVALKLYGGLSGDFQQVPTDDGRPMPWPTINPTGVTASYLTENAQLSNTAYVFGQGMLFGWTIAELCQASIQLVQDSAVDVDQLVADRIGEAIGRKIATEVMSGSGPSNQAYVGIIPALVRLACQHWHGWHALPGNGHHGQDVFWLVN